MMIDDSAIAVVPIPAVVGALVALGCAGFWAWHRIQTRRRDAESTFDEFKTRVVSLSDTLEELRERHRLLPFTDSELSAAMDGETRRVYESIQETLDEYRDLWLQRMDVWDRARELIDSERFGRTGRLAEATMLLEQHEDFEPIEGLGQTCREQIERIVAASEQAEQARERVEQATGTLVERIERLESVGISTELWQTELDQAAEITDEAEVIAQSDPIGAIAGFDAAKEAVNGLITTIDRVLAASDKLAAMTQTVADAEQSIAKHRSEGFLFAEPDANPDEVLSEARRHLEAIGRHLDAGDAASAEREQDQAARRLRRCEQVVADAQLMRDQCADLVASLRTQIAELRDAAGAADLERQTLQFEHAPGAWDGVAANIDQTRAMADLLSRMIDDAADAAADDVQHFTRARGLLSAVEARCPEARELLIGVGERLRQLNALRAETQDSLGHLQRDSDRIRNLLAQSPHDRSLCNHRFSEASNRLALIRDTAAKQTVDWPDIRRRSEDVQSDFERVEQLYQEDLRLARQAEAEITEAERELRSAKSFYRSGVTADVTIAEMKLSDARTLLRSQKYERVVEAANAAEQAARDARADAVRRMEQRQQVLDRRRRDETVRQMSSVLELAGEAATRTLATLTRR